MKEGENKLKQTTFSQIKVCSDFCTMYKISVYTINADTIDVASLLISTLMEFRGSS